MAVKEFQAFLKLRDCFVEALLFDKLDTRCMRSAN
jgi:hypothetical protein